MVKAVRKIKKCPVPLGSIGRFEFKLRLLDYEKIAYKDRKNQSREFTESCVSLLRGRNTDNSKLLLKVWEGLLLLVRPSRLASLDLK